LVRRNGVVWEIVAIKFDGRDNRIKRRDVVEGNVDRRENGTGIENIVKGNFVSVFRRNGCGSCVEDIVRKIVGRANRIGRSIAGSYFFMASSWTR